MDDSPAAILAVRFAGSGSIATAEPARRVTPLTHRAVENITARWTALLLMQVVFLQELRAEILRWRVNVRAAFGRKVHQIPIGPHRVDMIGRELGGPGMKNLATAPGEDMHHRQLHVIGVALAFV